MSSFSLYKFPRFLQAWAVDFASDVSDLKLLVVYSVLPPCGVYVRRIHCVCVCVGVYVQRRTAVVRFLLYLCKYENEVIAVLSIFRRIVSQKTKTPPPGSSSLFDSWRSSYQGLQICKRKERGRSAYISIRKRERCIGIYGCMGWPLLCVGARPNWSKGKEEKDKTRRRLLSCTLQISLSIYIYMIIVSDMYVDIWDRTSSADS